MKEYSTPSQAQGILSGIISGHTQLRALNSMLDTKLPEALERLPPHRSPHDVIKAPDPCALSGIISASLNPCNVSTGVPDPLGIFCLA
jgi:hypothetical protein